MYSYSDTMLEGIRIQIQIENEAREYSYSNTMLESLRIHKDALKRASFTIGYRKRKNRLQAKNGITYYYVLIKQTMWLSYCLRMYLLFTRVYLLKKNRAIPLSEFRAEEATIARFLSRQSTLITSMWKNASQRVIDFELGVTHHTEHTMAYMPRSSR